MSRQLRRTDDACPAPIINDFPAAGDDVDGQRGLCTTAGMSPNEPFSWNPEAAVLVARSDRAARAWSGLKGFGGREQLFPGWCWRRMGDEPDVDVAAVIRRVDRVDAHAPAVIELL
jgi:hypothetical protein